MNAPLRTSAPLLLSNHLVTHFLSRGLQVTPSLEQPRNEHRCATTRACVAVGDCRAGLCKRLFKSWPIDAVLACLVIHPPLLAAHHPLGLAGQPSAPVVWVCTAAQGRSSEGAVLSMPLSWHKLGAQLPASPTVASTASLLPGSPSSSSLLPPQPNVCRGCTGMCQACLYTNVCSLMFSRSSTRSEPALCMYRNSMCASRILPFHYHSYLSVFKRRNYLQCCDICEVTDRKIDMPEALKVTWRRR